MRVSESERRANRSRGRGEENAPKKGHFCCTWVHTRAERPYVIFGSKLRPQKQRSYQVWCPLVAGKTSNTPACYCASLKIPVVPRQWMETDTIIHWCNCLHKRNFSSLPSLQQTDMTFQLIPAAPRPRTSNSLHREFTATTEMSAAVKRQEETSDLSPDVMLPIAALLHGSTQCVCIHSKEKLVTAIQCEAFKLTLHGESGCGVKEGAWCVHSKVTM